MPMKPIVSMENLLLKFCKKFRRQFIFIDNICILVADIQRVQKLPVQSEISDRKTIIVDNELEASVPLEHSLHEL